MSQFESDSIDFCGQFRGVSTKFTDLSPGQACYSWAPPPNFQLPFVRSSWVGLEARGGLNPPALRTGLALAMWPGQITSPLPRFPHLKNGGPHSTCLPGIQEELSKCPLPSFSPSSGLQLPKSKSGIRISWGSSVGTDTTPRGDLGPPRLSGSRPLPVRAFLRRLALSFRGRAAFWVTRPLASTFAQAQAPPPPACTPYNGERALARPRPRRRDGGAMPRHCSAAGCCTRDTRETRTRGISFHRLPKKDNPRRGLWLANCRRLDPSGQGLWDPASEYIYFCSKHFEENCFELVGFSGYHRLKEGAVPTIFESFSKLRRTSKAKAHGYHPSSPDLSQLRRRRRRCSTGRAPPPPANGPTPADVPCFPGDELPTPEGPAAPGSLPALPPSPAPSGLVSPFSDLLEPLEPHGEEASCGTPPSPEREPSPSPSEARPVSPSAYMLRLPPPAGAYIQNEHSYQVGSALLWKRRAEAALDALDKAQRQLQACKRREQRLRLRIARLQQERAREKRSQADARQALKEHLQGLELQ